jgi:hypothetical protein
MPEFQPTIHAQPPVERRPCPRCGWDMMPTLSVPEGCREQLIYECTRCGDEPILRANCIDREIEEQRKCLF